MPRKPVSPEKHPILSAHLASGAIWVEDSGSSYVGRASDGTVVQIGDTWHPERAEYYLRSRPSPSEW